MKCSSSFTSHPSPSPPCKQPSVLDRCQTSCLAFRSRTASESDRSQCPLGLEYRALSVCLSVCLSDSYCLSVCLCLRLCVSLCLSPPLPSLPLGLLVARKIPCPLESNRRSASEALVDAPCLRAELDRLKLRGGASLTISEMENQQPWPCASASEVRARMQA